MAAAIVVPSALASGGQSDGKCITGKSAPAIAARSAAAGKAAGAVAGKGAGAPAGGVPPQFLAAVARLQQTGTISAAQARTLDADIESGSIDPKQLVATGVMTAAQMKAVNDRLVAVKMGLAAQAHGGVAAP
ncbi:MAG TPA: hypothetical protein VNV17_05905 [Solirubrobacteraceae bacterium]|nr:hypothetical protein [Solirubrobacteraceae bacterium]